MTQLCVKPPTSARCYMSDDAQEWLVKATKDLRSAERELNCGESANLDLVCFLCQQGVEKMTKGALIARSVTPPRIHDLVQLHRLLQSIEPSWKWDEAELYRLSVGAVVYRYP